MMYKSLALAALLVQSGASASSASSSSASIRALSMAKIAGYEPTTMVTDHAAIDRDQASIETQVGYESDTNFNKASAIYQGGGHSKSYAVLKLTTVLTSDVTQGASVTGVNALGESVSGELLEAAESGDDMIKVRYAVSNDPMNHVGCMVGELPADEHVTTGCFAAEGNVTIMGKAYPYKYTVAEDNDNGRTIRGFSTDAKKKMYDCPNCPYKDYLQYYEYYGDHDYADKWVRAAIGGGQTNFEGKGDADFSQYGFQGRAEAVKKGTAYMNVFMYVIREMRDAVDDCRAGKIKDNDDAVTAWDEAVAFYTGSLEGVDGSGNGHLLYSLADKRCANFKTCGKGGDGLEGTSMVNHEVFKLFASGQAAILAGQCDDLEGYTDKIVDLMTVPLVQGTIRYAHSVGVQQQGEKAMAEGATFAAAVLPRLNKCSSADATTVYNNMRVGAGGTDYLEVKRAFERNYECLGFTCEHVGGLFNTASDDYYADSRPDQCLGATAGAVSLGSIGVAIAGAVSAAAMLLL